MALYLQALHSILESIKLHTFFDMACAWQPLSPLIPKGLQYRQWGVAWVLYDRCHSRLFIGSVELP